MTISNGLDWSPDGSLAYYNDTATHRVDVFDYERDAGLTGRRPLVQIPVEVGGPDGPDRRLGGWDPGGAQRRRGGAPVHAGVRARRGGRATRAEGHRMHLRRSPPRRAVHHHLTGRARIRSPARCSERSSGLPAGPPSSSRGDGVRAGCRYRGARSRRTGRRVRLAGEWMEGALPATWFSASPARVHFQRVLISDWVPDHPMTLGAVGLLPECAPARRASRAGAPAGCTRCSTRPGRHRAIGGRVRPVAPR